MSYDSDEHIKKVFAHFGLACYLCDFFEAGLAQALLTLDFLTRQKKEVECFGMDRFDRTKFGAEYDTFLASRHSRFLGISLGAFMSWRTQTTY